MEEVETIQPTQPKKFERNSAFEILRIVAMLFIIAHHFSYHGHFSFADLEPTPLLMFNQVWLLLLAQLGKAGVNIFVLISGYFLVESKFRVKKAINIVLEMLTFSLIIGITYIIVENREITYSLVMFTIFPVGSGAWWFLTSYLFLYVLSPLLSKGLKAIDRKAHLSLIILFLIIWSFMPTFLSVTYDFAYFGWFLTLYLIGAYVRLYDFKFKVNAFVGILIAVLLFLSFLSVQCVFKYCVESDSPLLFRVKPWFNTIVINNFLQVICSILLFLSFKMIKMKNCKWINIAASNIMTVYIFHEQTDIRKLLWNTIFKNATFGESPYLFIYSIFVILCVFIMGFVIGMVYRYSFGYLYNKIMDKFLKPFLDKVDNVFNRTKNEMQGE